jgi:hypothetical protein
MYASIGGVDITPYIQETSYDVNQYEEYEEWKDGNRKKHREVMRTYVEGDFDLVFVTASDLNAFLTLLENNKVDGHLPITLYIQNLNQNKVCSVLYEFKATKDRQISNTYFYKRFKMSIVEE